MTQAANLAALGTNAGTTGILPIAGGGTAGTGGAIGFKNRIINGAMVIDQRNAGASVTPTGGNATYTLDRWRFYTSVSSKFTTQQNAGSVTPPAGFTNYLGITSSSAYSVAAGDIIVMNQYIEGYNFADLGWGTANAKTVTLSFWVRSSLTGSFGGYITTNTGARYYPYNYTISAANTWEYKTITIAGDTSASWSTSSTNGVGAEIGWSISVGTNYNGTANTWTSSAILAPTGSVNLVGTNGATLYITGVQLEVGTAATNFDVRSYGTEDFLCKRYYYLHASGATVPIGNFEWISSSDLRAVIHLPVTMRANPSVVSTAGSNFYRGYDGASIYFTSFLQDIVSRTTVAVTGNNSASGATQGRGGVILTDSASASLAFNAEL